MCPARRWLRLGRRAHQHVQRFVTPAPRARVWAWLVDPATFTDTQIPPWRVEFLGGGFDEGAVTTHHGPGLHLPGVLSEIRDGEYRDLQYLCGAWAVSFRLLRPPRLQISVADAPGGTDVEVQIDAHIHPRMLRLWAISQRLFWRRFETWTGRAVSGPRRGSGPGPCAGHRTVGTCARAVVRRLRRRHDRRRPPRPHRSRQGRR